MAEKDEKNRHPSMRRLLEAAAERGVHGPAALARRLQQSDATVTNWATRGVSQRGAVAAQEQFGCSAIWITRGRGQKFVGPGAAPVQSTSAPATHSPMVQKYLAALGALLEAIPDADIQDVAYEAAADAISVARARRRPGELPSDEQADGTTGKAKK